MTCSVDDNYCVADVKNSMFFYSGTIIVLVSKNMSNYPQVIRSKDLSSDQQSKITYI